MVAGVTLMRPQTLQLSEEISVEEDVLIEDADVTLIGKTKVATGVTIERGCWIKDCGIGSRTVIKAYSHLEGAVIGTQASVGPFARFERRHCIR